MKLLIPLLTLLILFNPFNISFTYAIEVGQVAPSFEIKSANGKLVKLKELRGKIVVLEWLNHGCPFIKKHYRSGNMQALQKKYSQQGVVWLSVISSAKGKQGYSDPDKAKEDRKKYGAYATHILLDTDGKVGMKYGAKTTPHMFVIDKDGILAYQGAIDSIASANMDDIKSATNYVAAAVSALIQQKDVEVAKTRPYGCSVKY